LPIFEEFPNRIAQKWKDEAKQLRKQQENVEMECDSDDSKELDDNGKRLDTGRDLFKNKV
jgi:hypothetical protein